MLQLAGLAKWEVPLVCPPRRNAQGSLLALAPNDDRRAGPLHWLWLTPSIGELVVGAIEVEPLLSEQPIDNRTRFFEPVKPLSPSTASIGA